MSHTPDTEMALDLASDGERGDDNAEVVGPPRRAERRQLEPFEVPTSGAFFMHDDRFGGADALAPYVRNTQFTCAQGSGRHCLRRTRMLLCWNRRCASIL